MAEGVPPSAAVVSSIVPPEVVAEPAALPAVPPVGKVATYVGALQPNGWYCGPAAARIALSAHGILPSFDDLANDLGTTMAGTSSIFDVTRVLNYNYGYERYQSVEIPVDSATAEQVEKLRTDVVATVHEGDIVVANIVGTITDTAGEIHSYDGGHYVTITGYADAGATVTVTDPADRVGGNEYQVPIGVMADWIAARGYAA
jgi:hypothetical protein